MGSFVITRRDGSRGTVLYDAADEPLLARHHWSLSTQGYAVTQARQSDGSRRMIRLNRLLMGLDSNNPLVVDHINGDRLDNRRANLRVVTRQANVAHQPRVNSRGSSKYRGVYFEKKRGCWAAKVKADYRNVWIGYFPDEEEAAMAVARFREAHGLPVGY